MKKSGHAAQLRRKLVEWVATGGSLSGFAKANPGRSERQYRRWAADPSFKAAVRDRSAELTETIVRQLRAVSAMSAGELRSLLANPDPAIRLGAVRTALRALIAIGKHADLEARILELEKANVKHRGSC